MISYYKRKLKAVRTNFFCLQSAVILKVLLFYQWNPYCYNIWIYVRNTKSITFINIYIKYFVE